MNGTSIDGIDISLIQSDGKQFIKPLYNKTYNYTKRLRIKLKNLIEKFNEQTFYEIFNSEEYKNLEKTFSIFCFRKVGLFLKKYNIPEKKIDLFGFHGQTMYHNPLKKVSIQLGSAEFLSKKFNKTVISNFRQADIENGGQGAPLVPIFHQKIFSKKKKKIAVVNIGGISNLTLLLGKKKFFSTDIGPGNRLIDDYCDSFFKTSFDKNGNFSMKGKENIDLVKQWMNFKIFKKKMPRSYDSNDFNLINFISIYKLNKYDMLASLVLLSSELIKKSFSVFVSEPDYVILAGGGLKNKNLVSMLKAKNNIKVYSSDFLGWSSSFIESQAFAYLAIRKVLKLKSSFPNTTGVKIPTICGEKFEFLA